MKTIKINVSDDAYRRLKALHKVAKIDEPKQTWDETLRIMLMTGVEAEEEHIDTNNSYAVEYEDDRYGDIHKYKVWKKYLKTGR
jgi:hypothetical protein